MTGVQTCALPIYNGLLGFVKWYPMWRKYCFVPLNCILDDGCLIEIAEFLKERTDKHKELKPRKTGVRIAFIQQPLRFPKERTDENT